MNESTHRVEESVGTLTEEPRKSGGKGLKKIASEGPAVSALGHLIQRAMKLLDLSYQDITSRSGRLADVYENPDMRIGKSTLGNIISGLIRQPSIAKLDSLRIILHLSRDEIDLATGLAPECRLSEQLQSNSERTYEWSNDLVARHQTVLLPILREDADLK